VAHTIFLLKCWARPLLFERRYWSYLPFVLALRFVYGQLFQNHMGNEWDSPHVGQVPIHKYFIWHWCHKYFLGSLPCQSLFYAQADILLSKTMFLTWPLCAVLELETSWWMCIINQCKGIRAEVGNGFVTLGRVGRNSFFKEQRSEYGEKVISGIAWRKNVPRRRDNMCKCTERGMCWVCLQQSKTSKAAMPHELSQAGLRRPVRGPGVYFQKWWEDTGGESRKWRVDPHFWRITLLALLTIHRRERRQNKFARW
jgi:hypothetical protein